MNLQVGGTPDKMKGLASGIGWVNLDFGLPKKSLRRRLLQTNPYNQASSLFVYSVLLFLLPFTLVHMGTQHYLMTQKGKNLKGIMLFPQIELTIALLLIAPYGKSVGALFSLGTARSVFAGLGMIVALPLPVLLFSMYIVKKHVLEKRSAKYVVFHKTPEIHGLLHIVRQGLFASPSTGFWKEKKKNLLDKYGIFFKSVRGPIYTFENKIYRYDAEQKAYKWGRVFREPDRFAYLRAYYNAYFIVRMVLISILLNAFPYSSGGNIAQTILLMTLLTIHVYFMIFASPLIKAKEQFVEISSNACELGTYASGFGLLMARRLHLDGLITLAGDAMFVFQLLSVGVQIIAQLWNVVLVFQMVRSIIEDKLFKKDTTKTIYHVLLSKKYANRWLLHVHHRPLKEWEYIYRDYDSHLTTNSSPKDVVLVLKKSFVKDI